MSHNPTSHQLIPIQIVQQIGGIYQVSPFNPLKIHTANHGRQPGIVDHRTAKKHRGDMILDSLNTTIRMPLRQMARDYLRIAVARLTTDPATPDRPTATSTPGMCTRFLCVFRHAMWLS